MKRCFCIVLLFFFTKTTCFGQGGWVWAKAFDGGTSSGISMASDKDGNVLVTGYFRSTITFGSFHLTATSSELGGRDIFVAKFDSLGNTIWVKSFGGTKDDVGLGIATDSDGNPFITGYFESSEITFGNSILANTYTNQNIITGEFFITKLSSNGNVMWAKKASGDLYDDGESIVVDKNGSAYVVGNFQSHHVTFDDITISHNEPEVTIVVKYDLNGNVVWAKNLFGTTMGWGGFGNSLAIDISDNIYLTGSFTSPSLTFGNITIQNQSDSHIPSTYVDIFLIKFSSDGEVMWAKDIGGGGFDGGTGVATDRLGHVYITGFFCSSTINFGITTLYNPIPGCVPDIFVAKFDSAGNSKWAKSAASTRADYSFDIIVNQMGNVFITGVLSAGNLYDTLTFGDIRLPSYDHRDDIFVAQWDSNGTALWGYRTGLNGDAWNYGDAIAADSRGNVYVTGLSTLFSDVMDPLPFGATTFNSTNDMFLAKLKPCHQPDSVENFAEICSGETIVLKSISLTNNVWSTGAVSPSIIVKAPGKYSVTVSNSSNCKVQSVTTTVNVNPLPHASITASTEILCENGYAIIESNEALSYLWNTGATSQSISVSNAGSYHVTITDANGCHATSDHLELKYIEPLPDVTLLSDCNKIFINQDLYVNWFQNDENIKLDSTLKEFYPPDSGNYHIEISNQCGIKKSNIVHFKPANPHFLSMPNVITPNGDGLNEFFILDEKLSGSALQIINRWGKEVYSSEEYENNWNGDDLSSGTYYYIISNSCFAENLKGVLSIVR